MKLLALPALLLGLSACGTNVITDPIGEPFRLIVRAAQAQAGSPVTLDALVDYGGFGGVPATVEFLNGGAVVATTSERTLLYATAEEPWDFKFSHDIAATPGTTLNLSARITWTYRGAQKALTSGAVAYTAR